MRILHFPILFNPGFFVDQNFEPITSVTVNTDEGWLYRDRQGDVSNGYIRHYWCKSFEEFAIKKIRGDALGLEDNFYRRNFSDFFAWNASDSAAMHKPPSDWLVERVDREYQFLLEIPGIRSLQETLERDFERLFDPIGGPEKLRLIYDRFLAERQPVRRPDG